MAPGGQWLRRGPVPACAAAAPAPRPLPCPRPATPGGIVAPSAPYVPRRTKFAWPRGATHPQGCGGRMLGSGEGCHELSAAAGERGVMPAAFYCGPAEPRTAAPTPPKAPSV